MPILLKNNLTLLLSEKTNNQKYRIMKKLLLICILASVQMVQSQVKKSLEDFTVIKTYDGIEVVLIPSKENSVEFSGVRAAEMETEIKDGVLKIKMGVGKLVKGDQNKATVYFKRILTIDANEGSSVVCDKAFDEPSMQILAQEGAHISVKIKCLRMVTRAVTGASVKLVGSSDNNDVTVFTGGVVDAKGLKTKNSVVSVSAGGSVEVYASESVDAKTKAGGSIKVYGNPAKVTQKTTLGGSIDIMK